MPRNKLEKNEKNIEVNMQKSKRMKYIVNAIKHLRDFLKGFNDWNENLSKRLLESFSGWNSCVNNECIIFPYQKMCNSVTGFVTMQSWLILWCIIHLWMLDDGEQN